MLDTWLVALKCEPIDGAVWTGSLPACHNTRLETGCRNVFYPYQNGIVDFRWIVSVINWRKHADRDVTVRERLTEVRVLALIIIAACQLHKHFSILVPWRTNATRSSWTGALWNGADNTHLSSWKYRFFRHSVLKVYSVMDSILVRIWKAKETCLPMANENQWRNFL